MNKSKIIRHSAFILLLTAILTACSSNNSKKTDDQPSLSTPRTVTTEEVKPKTFGELFTSINEKDIQESVFKLVNQDYSVITAGEASGYNSMVASYGGWGVLFDKPVTWCFLRANRYTLEIIRKKGTYTMSYFDDNFKDQIMLFGTKSGRNSEKMKESTLTMVQTPSGNITYKEAKLIIECKLSQITTVSPDDFFEQGGRDFVTEAYGEAGEYHKMVFGNITGVWIRK